MYLDDNVGIGEQTPPTRRYDNPPLELGLFQGGQLGALCHQATFQMSDGSNQVIGIVGGLLRPTQAVQPGLVVLLLPFLSLLTSCIFPRI